MIPKHHTGLAGADFVEFARDFVSPPPRQPLAELFADHFQGRALFPTPLGRHALWYFLELVDLPRGSEVLVTSYNFYLVVRLLVQKGLRPVFVDIEPHTLCMDPEDLARKVTPRSKMVLVTHSLGHPANLPAIQAVAKREGLLLFEDCAHAFGTTCEGRQVGQAGDGALFSFGIEKMLTAFSGGMLALSEDLGQGYTPPPEPSFSFYESTLGVPSRAMVALCWRPSLFSWTILPGTKLARGLSRVGLPGLEKILKPSRDNPDYRFKPNSGRPFMAYKGPLLARQLDRLQHNIAERQRHVSRLYAQLEGVPGVTVLEPNAHGSCNGAYLGVCVPDSLALSEELARHGVDSNPRQFLNCAALTQFEEFANECPHAAHVESRMLRLPSFPTLEDRQVDHIAKVITDYLTRPH